MGTLKFDGNISIDEAIRRHRGIKKEVSIKEAKTRPMRLLYERGLLVGRMLDYGCGRGDDAKFFGMEAYDPYWMNKKPTGQFDTITCHFVLSSVGDHERQKIITDINNLLKFGGTAYYTVRREGEKKFSGYNQNLVNLNLPSIEKNLSYEIYEFKK